MGLFRHIVQSSSVIRIASISGCIRIWWRDSLDAVGADSTMSANSSVSSLLSDEDSVMVTPSMVTGLCACLLRTLGAPCVSTIGRLRTYPPPEVDNDGASHDTCDDNIVCNNTKSGCHIRPEAVSECRQPGSIWHVDGESQLRSHRVYRGSTPFRNLWVVDSRRRPLCQRSCHCCW